MSADDRVRQLKKSRTGASELIRWLSRLFREPEDVPIKGIRERVLPYTMNNGRPGNRRLVA